jgi:hypothetical protein
MGFLAPIVAAIGSGIATVGGGSVLAGVGTIATGLATVAQMITGVRAAGQDERTAKRIAAVEAQEAREDAARQAEAEAIEQRRLLGRQRVIAAAGGVRTGVGSPLMIELETLRLGRQEIEDVLLGGERKARTARITGFERVKVARARGREALLSGIGTLGSLATQSAGRLKTPVKKP